MPFLSLLLSSPPSRVHGAHRFPPHSQQAQYIRSLEDKLEVTLAELKASEKRAHEFWEELRGRNKELEDLKARHQELTEKYQTVDAAYQHVDSGHKMELEVQRRKFEVEVQTLKVRIQDLSHWQLAIFALMELSNNGQPLGQHGRGTTAARSGASEASCGKGEDPQR